MEEEKQKNLNCGEGHSYTLPDLHYEVDRENINQKLRCDSDKVSVFELGFEKIYFYKQV